MLWRFIGQLSVLFGCQLLRTHRLKGAPRFGKNGRGSPQGRTTNGVAFFGSGEKGGARKLMRRDSRLDRLPIQTVFTYRR